MQLRAIWRPPEGVRYVAVGGERVAVLDEGGVSVISPGGDSSAARLDVGPDARAVAIDDDGSTVAVIFADGRVRIVSPAAPAEGRELAVCCGLLNCTSVQGGPTRETWSMSPQDVVFAPDGAAMAVSSRAVDDFEYYYGGGWIASQARTELLRWPSGQVETVFADRAEQAITYTSRDSEGGADHAVAVAFSPCGRWLGLRLRSRRLVVRALAGDAAPVVPQGRIDAFAFGPGGETITVASGARVSTWDLVRGVERDAFVAGSEVVAVASSGSRLACIDGAGDVSILATPGGEPLASLPRVEGGPAVEVRWIGETPRVRLADGSVVIAA